MIQFLPQTSLSKLWLPLRSYIKIAGLNAKNVIFYHCFINYLTYCVGINSEEASVSRTCLVHVRASSADADYVHDLVCVPVMVMAKLNVAKLVTFEDTLSVKVAVMFEARLRMEFSRSHVNVKYFCAVVGFHFEVLMLRRSGIVPVFLM